MGVILAIISEEDKKLRMDMENARIMALHKKKEIAEQKKLLGEKRMTKKYQELKDDFINPKLLDFKDLDDCFLAIDRKPSLTEMYGQSSEKDRLILFAQMQDDLKFYALSDKEKYTPEEVKKMSQRLEQIIDDRNEAVKENLHTHVPIYTEYVCSCCGMPKPLRSFYRSWSMSDAARVDEQNLFHKSICIECCKKIFEYYYLVEYNKDPIKAMKRYCIETNTYWDYDIYLLATQQQKAHKYERHILSEYVLMLGSKNIYEGFAESPSLLENAPQYIIPAPVEEPEGEADPTLGLGTQNKDGWSVVDRKNKNRVLKLFGYNPFSYITDEEELKRVYRDFLNLLDEDMENDLVKLQAAAQIVSSYSRIRDLDREYEERKEAKVGAKALKDISDLKSKELKAISDFARDNGFAERWATAKAKGENTFTGILNRMNTAKFEDSVVNAQSILTSKAIQDVADASFKAIFSQLNLGEADVWKISQQQLEELVKLRAENSNLQERVRVAEYKAAEATLKDRASKERIEEETDGS